MVSQLDHPKDGFASEFQYVSRLLQMSVSTQRHLVLTPEWQSAYEPPDCRPKLDEDQSGWDCLWEPMLPACSTEQIQRQQNAENPDTANNNNNNNNRQMLSDSNPLSVGILPKKKATSNWFDVAWYSQQQQQLQSIMWAPTSFSRKKTDQLKPDIIPHWERMYGRYWVRAQMAHALWRPNTFLRNSIANRLPPADGLFQFMMMNTTHDYTPLFIGFHIRLTDNAQDMQRHFARNATQTRNLARFMAFAERIRSLHAAAAVSSSSNSREQPPTLDTIYLATDNRDILKQSKDPQWKERGWTFVTQTNTVERSTTTDKRMWFREGRSGAAGAIATDIEVLRRADYLVGSFQSNVYRLACQLNTAWNVHKYPWEVQRHWTVDVEWYEDP
ncbi:unknown protein [Seminavis robusta]|uniref:Uncharacterized protein n=1 Tax=Seminavis robusta TaxID=568900 RepID=A0A9N8HM44_9STRA|nr:unknown protein [Seminavis robusta]|eukprot:Sro967_g225910.1 n/a (386) ;mRNA; r:39817-40974